MIILLLLLTIECDHCGHTYDPKVNETCPKCDNGDEEFEVFDPNWDDHKH